jgi:hypothetical protein
MQRPTRREIVQCYFHELFNQGRIELVHELLHPDYVNRYGPLRGPLCALPWFCSARPFGARTHRSADQKRNSFPERAIGSRVRARLNSRVF